MEWRITLKVHRAAIKRQTFADLFAASISASSLAVISIVLFCVFASSGLVVAVHAVPVKTVVSVGALVCVVNLSSDTGTILLDFYNKLLDFKCKKIELTGEFNLLHENMSVANTVLNNDIWQTMETSKRKNATKTLILAIRAKKLIKKMNNVYWMIYWFYAN